MARAKILCVDDEPNPLFLRKLVLERAGFHVITAASSQQALEVLSRDGADLVVSDQLMPGTTGTELARLVKEQRPDLPVIIISGVNEVPPDASCADRFISKLEGPEFLVATIADVLVELERTKGQ